MTVIKCVRTNGGDIKTEASERQPIADKDVLQAAFAADSALREKRLKNGSSQS